MRAKDVISELVETDDTYMEYAAAYRLGSDVFIRCGGVSRGGTTVWYFNPLDKSLWYRGEDPAEVSDGMKITNLRWANCDALPDDECQPTDIAFFPPSKAEQYAEQRFGQLTWDDSPVVD